jgi:hypothetical protein
MELLASTGLVGLSLFLGYVGLLFRKFIRLNLGAPDTESKTLYFAINILLFIFAFFMITAVVYDAKEMMPILGSLAGWGQYRLLLLQGTPASPWRDDGIATGG